MFLKTVRENFVVDGVPIAYQLESGLMLQESDCNGECYMADEVIYIPVMEWLPKTHEGMEYATLETVGFVVKQAN